MKKFLLSFFSIAVFAVLVVVSCKRKDPSINFEMSFPEETYKITESEALDLIRRLVITPEEMDTISLSWSSSDASIAEVSASGRVVGVYEGKAVITVTAYGKSASCQVIVTPVEIKSFSIPNALTAEVGVATPIKVDVEPSNANPKHLKWSSSVDGVVPEWSEENDWVLNTDYIGDLTLTASYSDLKPQTCNVTVKVVPIQKIELTKAVYNLTFGKSMQLTYNIVPENASYKDVKFSSADADIVSVNADGFVQVADKETSKDGVIITVTHNKVNEQDVEVSSTCRIVVTENPLVEIKSFNLSSDILSPLSCNNWVECRVYNIEPAEAAAYAEYIDWSVEPASMVSHQSVRVEGGNSYFRFYVGETTGTMLVTATGGEYKLSEKIEVAYKKVKDIQFVKADDKFIVFPRLTYSLSLPKINPSDASYPELTYYVTDSKGNRLSSTQARFFESDGHLNMVIKNVESGEYTLAAEAEKDGVKSSNVIKFYYVGDDFFTSNLKDKFSEVTRYGIISQRVTISPEECLKNYASLPNYVVNKMYYYVDVDVISDLSRTDLSYYLVKDLKVGKTYESIKADYGFNEKKGFLGGTLEFNHAIKDNGGHTLTYKQVYKLNNCPIKRFYRERIDIDGNQSYSDLNFRNDCMAVGVKNKGNVYYSDAVNLYIDYTTPDEVATYKFYSLPLMSMPSRTGNYTAYVRSASDSRVPNYPHVKITFCASKGCSCEP